MWDQEFLHGEKVEQEIAEGCRRLIKNAIICWNYVYLSQRIADEPDPEKRRAHPDVQGGVGRQSAGGPYRKRAARESRLALMASPCDPAIPRAA